MGASSQDARILLLLAWIQGAEPGPQVGELGPFRARSLDRTQQENPGAGMWA
jgi:hypothetical protein